MAQTERLSSRILSRLQHHQSGLSERQKLIDSTMKDLTEQQERFAADARRILESVINPQVEALMRFFDNATIVGFHGDTDFHCVCKFSHTSRFPATVSLDFSILPGESRTVLKARYDLEILPSLMEYKRDEEKTFPFEGSDEAIGLWVEEKIIEFTETYLRLETHPLYQKDNMVSDPVCGMRIPAIAAKGKVEWPGHTIYFCSEICKEAFLKENR